MTQDEVKSWLEMLPYFQQNNLKLRRSQSDAERIAVITDLLKHANRDKMTTEDRGVCNEAIQFLQSRGDNGKTQQHRERPDVQELSDEDPDDVLGTEETLPDLLQDEPFGDEEGELIES